MPTHAHIGLFYNLDTLLLLCRPGNPKVGIYYYHYYNKYILLPWKPINRAMQQYWAYTCTTEFFEGQYSVVNYMIVYWWLSANLKAVAWSKQHTDAFCRSKNSTPRKFDWSEFTKCFILDQLWVCTFACFLKYLQCIKYACLKIWLQCCNGLYNVQN